MVAFTPTNNKGFTILRGAAVALPATLLALALHFLKSYLPDVFEAILSGASTGQVWAGYNFVLGFTLVFRTQNAYTRYWEGSKCLTRSTAQWRSAISSCFAFRTQSPGREEDVLTFQRQLVQLASLLHCVCLQQIAQMADEHFDIIELNDLDQELVEFLYTSDLDRPGIVMQWVQKLIMHAQTNGILSAPAPIVSRSFQELSQGFISFSEAKLIREVPFPYPFLQMVKIMLITSTFGTPLVNTLALDNVGASCIITFVMVSALWALKFIADEIEMPFGDDANDLPVREMQNGFNAYLRMLESPDMDSAPIPQPAGTGGGLRKTRRTSLAVVAHKSSERSKPRERGPSAVLKKEKLPPASQSISITIPSITAGGQPETTADILEREDEAQRSKAVTGDDDKVPKGIELQDSLKNLVSIEDSLNKLASLGTGQSATEKELVRLINRIEHHLSRIGLAFGVHDQTGEAVTNESKETASRSII